MWLEHSILVIAYHFIQRKEPYRELGAIILTNAALKRARNHLTVGWTWGAGRVPGEAGVRVMVTRVQLDKLGARIEELAALRRVHLRNTPIINGGLCQGMME